MQQVLFEDSADRKTDEGAGRKITVIPRQDYPRPDRRKDDQEARERKYKADEEKLGRPQKKDPAKPGDIPGWKRGYRLIDPEVDNSTANCHGTTFDAGRSHVNEVDVPKIRDDNYEKKPKVDVCCVLIYQIHAPALPRHSVLVVEVDDAGIPTWVVGKDGDAGEIWVHEPDRMNGKDGEKDWEGFCRKKVDLDAKEQLELDKWTREYDKAKKDYDEKKNEDNWKKMHKAAYEMCRRKNRLKNA